MSQLLLRQKLHFSGAIDIGSIVMLRKHKRCRSGRDGRRESKMQPRRAIEVTPMVEGAMVEHPPLVEEKDVVLEGLYLFDTMRADEDGNAVRPRNPLDEREQFTSTHGVDTRRWLVENEKRRS